MLPSLGQTYQPGKSMFQNPYWSLFLSVLLGMIASVSLLLAMHSPSLTLLQGSDTEHSSSLTTAHKNNIDAADGSKPTKTRSSIFDLFERGPSKEKSFDTKTLLEIAEATYERHMKQRQFAADPATCTPPDFCEHPSHFQMLYFAPVYPCIFEAHVGAWGEGGKWLCNTTGAIPHSGIVYSVGSNGDPGFEKSMFEVFQLKSYTFDPTLTPDQLRAVDHLPYVEFHAIGLTGTENSGDPRMLTLLDIMKSLNHTYIDIFKIDCEGCEVSFLQHLKAIGRRDAPLFGQMQMEIHDPNPAVLFPMIQTVEALGYRLFHVEPNFFWSSGWELAYIHESLTSVR